MKVLLVDDDSDLLDVTSYALRRDGFNVIVATDGAQALRRWQADEPDVVVLDVGLPRMNGLEVCHKIRQDSTTPVILLTARSDEDHIVQGFRLGADDYVTKPFSPRQLSMRIQAVSRRGAAMGEREPTRELRVGDLVLDVESHEVHCGDVRTQLTSIEFRLLYLLANNVGRVVASSRLVDYAWGCDGGDVSLLKTHISHIRTKLGLGVGGPSSISVVPSVGYRLTHNGGEAAGRTKSTTSDAGDPIPLHAGDLDEDEVAAGVS
jgi:DNA-binding response OmpR family regulator